MPKYMSQFSYSTASIKGMVQHPQDRRAAAQKIFAAAGGTIEAMYFTFGEYDGVVITDFPDDVAAASAVMAVGASGAFSDIKTTILMTMEDAVSAMKGANKIVTHYTPPSE